MKHFKNVCKVFIVIWILLQFQSCEKETEVLVSKYDMYNHLSSKIKQIITEIDFDNIDYNLLKTINSSDFYKKENDAQLQKAVILFDEYSKIHKQFELTFGVNELQLALNKAFLENTKKLTETNQTNTEKRSTPCYDEYESEMLYNIGIFTGCSFATGSFWTIICLAVFIHDSSEDAETFHECCGC